MEILDKLKQSIDLGQAFALCTVVKTNGTVPRHAGTKMIVFPDGRFEGTVGGGKVEELVREEAVAALKDGQTRFLDYSLINTERGDPGLCGGTVVVYVEPYLRPATVVVVGAGHVGRSVIHLASWLGFRVVVSDDREGLCTPEACPGADQYLPLPLENLTEAMEIGSRTYLVLVTRGVEVDVAGLPSLLATDAPYIGLIGSNKRWTHCRKQLKAAGMSEDQIARIKSPIGLDIRAETPDEIAVSIMAEIIALRNQNTRPARKV